MRILPVVQLQHRGVIAKHRAVRCAAEPGPMQGRKALDQQRTAPEEERRGSRSIRGTWSRQSESSEAAELSLTQRQPRCGLELGDRLLRIRNLYLGHAHLPRRLQVDAEIVEIDAFFG